jgi:beta-ureidopropionase / N-carbamoyl-L-amino-acid hydrolase
MTDPALDRAARLGRSLFQELGSQTQDAPGVTRVAYGEGERKAFALAAAAAAGIGASTDVDPAGNQFLTLPGRDRSARIVIGSHLDSVPHGGNFDGAAGVFLGLAVQAAFVERKAIPSFDLTVACLRAEESCWFPHSYIGSKSALGCLDPCVLDKVRRSDTGRSLADHMQEEGLDPDAVRRGARWLDPSSILGFIEPHIEQAPLLLSQAIPLGIVTGIRGARRYRAIRCFGEYGHSGAMPRHLRRDAVVASAQLVLELDALWAAWQTMGEDLTVTFGEFGTDPGSHSFSKVAGETHVCLDLRSQNRQTLERILGEVERLVDAISEERNVTFDLGPLTGSEPAHMSESLNAILADAARMRGIEAIRMPSGAGHDAATFAQVGIPTTMLFIRNENGSHNPDEHMDMADFDRALEVLFTAVSNLPERWEAGSYGVRCK